MCVCLDVFQNASPLTRTSSTSCQHLFFFLNRASHRHHSTHSTILFQDFLRLFFPFFKTIPFSESDFLFVPQKDLRMNSLRFFSHFFLPSKPPSIHPNSKPCPSTTSSDVDIYIDDGVDLRCERWLKFFFRLSCGSFPTLFRVRRCLFFIKKKTTHPPPDAKSFFSNVFPTRPTATSTVEMPRSATQFLSFFSTSLSTSFWGPVLNLVTWLPHLQPTHTHTHLHPLLSQRLCFSNQ